MFNFIFDLVVDRPFKAFFCVIILSFSLVTGAIAIGDGWEVEQGEFSGVVTQVYRGGKFWDTTTVQVSFSKETSTRPYELSIDEKAQRGENREELETILRKALKTGQQVRIRQVGEMTCWPWRGSSSYFIQSVEITNE